jgi:hypothetical protein
MSNVNVNNALPIDLDIGGGVVLNGSNTTWSGPNPRGAGWPASFNPSPGSTSVDETVINDWLTANAALPMVANGLIALAS